MKVTLLIRSLVVCGIAGLALSGTAYANRNNLAFQVADEDATATDGSPLVYADNTPVKKKYNSGKKYKAKKSGGGFASSRPATGRKVFIFNPNILRWGVYDESGNLVRTGHGVGGRYHCPDVGRRCKTPSGVFSIWNKAGAGFRSSRYPLPRGGAPMPYAMFFSKYYAIHGSNDVPNYNASHGCIRVYTSDARWLNQNFLNYGSTVIVHGY